MKTHLNEYELSLLRDFIYNKIPSIDENVLSSASYIKGLKKNIPQDYQRQLTITKRAHVVKTAFTAAVLRHIIKTRGFTLPSSNELKRYDFYEKGDLVITNRQEVLFLLGFIRTLKTMLSLNLDGRSNKILFLNVCSVLEGSGKIYATGGAPSKAAKRREIILEDLTVNFAAVDGVHPLIDDSNHSSLGKRSLVGANDDVHPASSTTRHICTTSVAPKKRGRPRRAPLQLPIADESVSIATLQDIGSKLHCEFMDANNSSYSSSSSSVSECGNITPSSDTTGESTIFAEDLSPSKPIPADDVDLMLACLSDDCLFSFPTHSVSEATQLNFATFQPNARCNPALDRRPFVAEDAHFYFDPSFEFMFNW